MVGDGAWEGGTVLMGDGGAQEGGLGWVRWVVKEQNKEGWDMVGNEST